MPSVEQAQAREGAWSAEAFLDRGRHRPPLGTWQRMLLFIVTFLVLQALYGLASETAIERWVVETATVVPAARLLAVARPDWQPRADGPRLVAAGKRINVRYGCEGTEVAFLLIAALAAARGNWRWRLAGMALGVAAVWALNQARLQGLVWVLIHERAWFSAVHGAIAPLLVIAATTLLFLAWLRFAHDVPAHARP